MQSSKRESERLRQTLEQEVERRRECEASVAERETELAQALRRLGEFERVSIRNKTFVAPQNFFYHRKIFRANLKITKNFITM